MLPQPEKVSRRWRATRPAPLTSRPRSSSRHPSRAYPLTLPPVEIDTSYLLRVGAYSGHPNGRSMSQTTHRPWPDRRTATTSLEQQSNRTFHPREHIWVDVHICTQLTGCSGTDRKGDGRCRRFTEMGLLDNHDSANLATSWVYAPLVRSLGAHVAAGPQLRAYRHRPTGRPSTQTAERRPTPHFSPPRFHLCTPHH